MNKTTFDNLNTEAVRLTATIKNNFEELGA